MKRNIHGFTLAELLIVVAIIAVLVAIAIPIFTRQLEKSRESTDFSNMRSAYAEVMVAAISDDAGSPLRQEDGTFRAEITLKQKQEDWQTSGVENMEIGGVPYVYWDSQMPAIGGKASVTFYPDSEKVKIDWGGSGSGSGSGSGGGSGSIPALHGSVSRTDETKFKRGDVIQDETGTGVIMQELWATWNAYTNGAKVADLARDYSSDVVLVDASNIKDSSSIGTLQEGDIYYDSATKTYYYVNLIDLSGQYPNGSWVPLKQ